MPIKICITGGPSGGKTTLIEALRKEMSGLASVVPEAASILYRGGFPRLPTTGGRIHAQQAIFAVQAQLENLVAVENPRTRLIICDRGSLDSLAYWPKSAAHFFKSVGTTRAKELRRYHWIIHLDTASRSSYDNSNSIRTESHGQALRLNQKILRAWAQHPRRVVISHKEDFLSKMTLSLAVIRLVLEGHSYAKIRNELLDQF